MKKESPSFRPGNPWFVSNTDNLSWGNKHQCTFPAAEQEIINLSKDKWQWMADKNTDKLADLFHEKAMFVHMGGSWEKEQEVNIIKSGGLVQIPGFAASPLFVIHKIGLESGWFSIRRCRFFYIIQSCF